MLGITDPASAPRQQNALNAELDRRNTSTRVGARTERVDLSGADHAFVQRGLALEPAYLDGLARNTGAGIGVVDYEHAAEPARAAINRWVADRTEHKITDLLPGGAIDAYTRLVLVDAVRLVADWSAPFAPDGTTPAPFHGLTGDTTAQLMHGGSADRYVEGDGWTSVDLSYAGGPLAMTVLVPDAGRFADVVGSLGPDLLARATDGTAVDSAVDSAGIRLPRFHVHAAIDLSDDLEALGMPTAFGPTADFSGITRAEQLQVSSVLHQADVTVDEKGTVAVAATADVLMAVGGPLHELVVDRPFLFFLRDRTTGAVLFAGQVLDPG